MKQIYYAHPMNLYDSLIESKDVELLEDLGFRVLNPNLFVHQIACRAFDNVMDYFCELVKQCDALAFRAFPSGKIGAGNYKEIQVAMRLHLPIIELPNSIVDRTLTLEETKVELKK